MSSTLTLESSTTQPHCNLFIPKAIGTIFGSLFQTKPSIMISVLIFSNKASKSVSISQTLTSKTIIDLAAGFSFFGLAGCGFGFGACVAGVEDSPNKSSSSATGSGFFSSFFCGFCCFPLKALWASLGRSFDPTVASTATTLKYQAVTVGQAFLSSSPRRVVKTTDNPVAMERSAIDNSSPTKNFLPDKCDSKTFKNL